MKGKHIDKVIQEMYSTLFPVLEVELKLDMYHRAACIELNHQVEGEVSCLGLRITNSTYPLLVQILMFIHLEIWI